MSFVIFAFISGKNRVRISIIFPFVIFICLISLSVIVFIQGAILTYSTYLIEATTIHRVHYIVIGSIGLGALYGLSNGVPVGFIPLLNQFLYLNTFRGGILNMAGIYGILPNSIRLNPFFRRTTSWAVFRGGASNNQGYRLQIKVKQWRPYQNNRPFWHKWWYGL